MLANVVLRGEVNNALEFLDSSLNPLTLQGLKEVFNLDKGKGKEDYEEFLKGETECGNPLEDNNEGVFEYLLSVGVCDEEMIEEVLKQEKSKWFVTFDEDNNGSFDIYEVLE